MIGVYNRREECLLCGTNWVFKSDISSFVLNGIKRYERFIKKNPTICNNVSKFYYSLFIWSSTCFGRHTDHHQELKTALAASGRCQARCAWQRPPTTRPSTFHVWKTSGCQCSFRLLMMGGVARNMLSFI